MTTFQNCLLNSRLYELKTTSKKYTWANKRSDATGTTKRLDWVLASKEGMLYLPGSYCEVLLRIKSDHSPLIINLCKGESETGVR